MLSAFSQFNERGVGGGCCPLSADSTSGGGGGRGAVRFRPIQSFNQWAEGAELLLQWGGGACPPGDALE